jgi:predicted tellurium resistance membrane protein TerC
MRVPFVAGCVFFTSILKTICLQAVGVILGIIALKMGLEGVGVHLLSPLQSLVLVTSVLGTGVALSLGKQMLSQNSAGNVDVS